MSTTKKIYFLSSIVLIIGCFALNLSYSLFVQTEEKEVVSASIPYINSGLSLTSISVEPGEYLIKQTVNNFGTADFNYAINTSSTSNDYTIRAVNDGTNIYVSTGMLSANSTKNLYFFVSNTGSDTITINFTLDKKYTTLNNDLSTNIDDENVYNLSIGVPYKNNTQSLSYKIIDQYINSNLYNGTKVTENEISELFPAGIEKVELPIESLEIETATFKDYVTTELGLFKAEDDYGTSYYFRGASTVNYVNFAGFTWRIVRINGDGSIRLILDGTLDKVTKDGVAVYLNENLAAVDSDGLVAFNYSGNDNAYIGYTYGDKESDTYDNTHKNSYSSRIKRYLEAFYKEYLLEYEYQISDTLFCGDKSLARKAIGSDNTALGYGINRTYYAAMQRIRYSSGEALLSTATPTLECAVGETNIYSRYTANETITTKGVNVNKSMTYPIGLISADELVMAGAWRNKTNKYYYLYDAYANGTLYDSWWTMTPAYLFNADSPYVFQSIATGKALEHVQVTTTGGVRPVISLKSTVEVKTGNGTYQAPYEIQEIVE